FGGEATLAHVRPLGLTDFTASRGTAQWGQVIVQRPEVKLLHVAGLPFFRPARRLTSPSETLGKSHIAGSQPYEMTLITHLRSTQSWSAINAQLSPLPPTASPQMPGLGG